jgi:hypothetical protein
MRTGREVKVLLGARVLVNDKKVARVSLQLSPLK